MEPNHKIPATDHSTAKNSQTLYGVLVSCNKCGGVHELGISVLLEDGPAEKKSIAVLYDGKTLPKNLADLTNTSVTCPKTGRQSIQKNTRQIFLVPAKS